MTLHECTRCHAKRECGSSCNEKPEEICVKCNNLDWFDVAVKMDLMVSDLYMDVLGGLHIKQQSIIRWGKE